MRFQDIIDLLRGKKEFIFVETPKYQYRKIYANYLNIRSKINEKINKKEKVKVGFVFVSGSVSNIFWTYLYDKFNKDDRFEPYMIVAPYIYLSSDFMKETTRQLESVLESRGYRVIKCYDFEKKMFADIKDFFSEGLMFFLDPYNHLTKEDYLLDNFISTSLTYYVPYGYCLANMENCVNMSPQKHAYKMFVETKLHIKMIQKFSAIKGKNLAGWLGYLGSQRLLEKKERTYPWKCLNNNVKKVIIAPHHLIGLGNFLKFHQTYLDIAEKYKDKISFVFKPHPILKETLLKFWSQKQIDEYFAKWNGMPNTKLELGDYENLFFTSDAMILDSVSFCAEYSLLNKPFLFIEKIPPHKFNPAGEQILEYQYRGNKEQDIYDFIENVILKEKDTKFDVRRSFVDENLLVSNHDIASNIYDYVVCDLEVN